MAPTKKKKKKKKKRGNQLPLHQRGDHNTRHDSSKATLRERRRQKIKQQAATMSYKEGTSLEQPP